jgi:hypothetical protein
MLLAIPFVQFDGNLVEAKVKSYKQKLSNVPFHVDNQSHELEIIPYERLWEMVMSGI